MPLSLDQAITQLDSGWLEHLQSQGRGGDALRQAVVLALYAQQQAAARNSACFKAAIKRVNGWLPHPFVCDNNGDYQFTAEWRSAPGTAAAMLSIEYAADPANWRAEYRLPGSWPRAMDNLDVTDTRAVCHDFGAWLGKVAHWCSNALLAQMRGQEAEEALPASLLKPAATWSEFEQQYPAWSGLGQAQGRDTCQVVHSPLAVASLRQDFDAMAAVLLHLTALLQAASQASAHA